MPRKSKQRRIDIIVNGHLHTRQDPIVTGKSTWLVLPAFEEPIAQEVLSLAELVTGQPIHADFSQIRLKPDPVANQSAEMETPVATQHEEPDVAPSRQQSLV